MRLSISVCFLHIGALVRSVQGFTLSGKILDRSYLGKSGVTVSVSSSPLTTSTDSNGVWRLSDGVSSVSELPRNHRSVAIGKHLVADGEHLRLSLLGFDLRGRPEVNRTPPSNLPRASVRAARRATALIPDTITYSWNGKVFLRDTVSELERTEIVAIFDTTLKASVLYGWLTDSRDGQIYEYVKIGSQFWMARNLNFKTDTSSRCYNDSETNCKTYGRYYGHYDLGGQLAVGSEGLLTEGVCPTGWHATNMVEWGILIDAVGNQNLLLSSTCGWLKKDTSIRSGDENPYGFNILPAGHHVYRGSFPLIFEGIGLFAEFATTEISSTSRVTPLGFNVSSSSVYSFEQFSLRCVKNHSP